MGNYNSTTEVRFYDDCVRVGILWIHRDWEAEDLGLSWYSSTLVDSNWHLSVSYTGRCWTIKVLRKEGSESCPLDQFLDPDFGHDALKKEVGFEGEFSPHGELRFEDVEEFYRVATELLGRFICIP